MRRPVVRPRRAVGAALTRRLRIACLGALALITVSAPAAAQVATAVARPRDACLAPPPRTLRALEQRVAELERAAPRTGEQQCELALLYATDGRLGAAEDLLLEVLRAQPERTDALLLLSQVLERSGRREQADSLLAQVAARDAALLPARLLRAARAPAGEAAALYRAILNDHPGAVEALVGLAADGLRRRADAEARTLLDRALALDPAHALAHVHYATIQQRANDTAAGRAALDRALAADSLSLPARQAYAQLLRSDGDRDGAFRISILAARLDPYGFGHGGVAQGGSRLSWPRHPPFQDDEVPPTLALELARADSLLLRRDLTAAEAAFRRINLAHPRLATARVGIGAAHYYRGEYEQAAAVFRDLARDFPGFGLAHFGVTQAEKMRTDARNETLQASLERFRQLPRPPEPARLRDVFPDFDRLDEDLRKIVLISIAPLSNYIPVLAAGGASFQLIPFHKRMWEVPNKQRTRGRFTFDLRLWDDVKGQGGFHALAGEEWIRDVMYERFNVLAHEFFHQVHAMLDEGQREEIEALFRLAKREGRTLDSYADYNEMEYMAQVYEAWISPRKTTRGGTGGHTFAEVVEKDPQAVRVLEQINERESYRENVVIAVRAGVRNEVSDGRLPEAGARARRALEEYGEHPLLLAALGGVLRHQGQHAGARDLHTRMIALDPDRFAGYQEAAEDHALGWHDHAAAAAVIASYLERDPDDEDAWLELAHLRSNAGQPAEAARALDRAGAIIGEPNPVARYHALRGALARASGDGVAARRDFNHILETIARNNQSALMGLALLGIEDGDLALARAHYGTAQAVSPHSALVREVGARVRHAEGQVQEARAILLALLEEDPARLATYTALIELFGREDAVATARYRAAGRQLIERRAPVRFVYLREQWVQQGELNAPAIAAFEAAVASVQTP